ncbi:MAG TPA: FixH family protein [Polyangiaceae bacterium]|nr:FixH family protein [Polyangiaceae bacterium]
MNEESSPTSTGSFWAWVPVGLLGSMLVGLGSMAYVAVNDPGFALEPNYYDKALHWDRSQAEAAASRELGLKLSLSKPLRLSESGKLELELAITDKSGASYGDAEVKVEAFAVGRASQLHELSLRELAKGRYAAEIDSKTLGLWELRVSVKKDRDHYREVLRHDASKGDAA